MKTGRKPTSTADLKIHGAFRADRHGDRADVTPAAGIPQKPADFGEIESALWDQVVPELVAKHQVGVMHTAQLVAMCRHYRHYIVCDRMAESDPTDKDTRIAVTQYWGCFDRVSSKFGLTSADFANLKIPTGGAKPSVPTRVRA